MYPVQVCKTVVSAVKDVEDSSFIRDMFHCLDIICRCWCNKHKTRNLSFYVKQGMYLTAPALRLYVAHQNTDRQMEIIDESKA